MPSVSHAQSRQVTPAAQPAVPGSPHSSPSCAMPSPQKASHAAPFSSQLSAEHASGSRRHLPATQVSEPLQKMPSSQSASIGVGWQAPSALQRPSVHGLSSASSQTDSAGIAQWSCSVQELVTHAPGRPAQGFPTCALHVVSLQVSAPLQKRPSSHDAPSALADLQSAAQQPAAVPFTAEPSSHSSPGSRTSLPQTGGGSHAGMAGSTVTTAEGVTVPVTVGWPLFRRKSFLPMACTVPATVIALLARSRMIPTVGLF